MADRIKLTLQFPDPNDHGLQEGFVRNMGNFNFSLTHVLTIFHHVEQCCYPSFLTLPHIPAMTSHDCLCHTRYTYAHHDTRTLYHYIFLMSFSFLMHLGPYYFYVSYLFPFLSYPCRLIHSV